MFEKVLPKDLWDKVVERHKIGEGYKKILNALAMPLSTTQCIIKKFKAYSTTKALPRPGHLSDLDGRARSMLVTESTKRLIEAVFIAGTDQCVHVTTISQALHKTVLYGNLATVLIVPCKTHLKYDAL